MIQKGIVTKSFSEEMSHPVWRVIVVTITVKYIDNRLQERNDRYALLVFSLVNSICYIIIDYL